MINILSELIYKQRYRLSDFDIERGGSADKCFFNALQRVRVFVDNGNGDFEPEYCSMFNMAYYLTTVIVNSDEPEQYYDEYLKRASEDFGVSLCGTGFPGEIKCMCVMLMVYWLIDTMKIVRPCERRLLNRIREWLVPEMTRVQLFVKEVPGPVLNTDRNLFAPRPLTPEELELTNWERVMPLFNEEGYFNSEDFEKLLFKIGKNAQEKLWIIDSLLAYIEQGKPFWIPLMQYIMARERLYEIMDDILKMYPELRPDDEEDAETGVAAEEKIVEKSQTVNPQAVKPERSKKATRSEILKYVMKLKKLQTLTPKDYRKLWGELLNIKEVKAYLYITGKQEHKDFNHYMIYNILGEFKSTLFPPGTTNTKIVEVLEEKGYSSSLRGQLASWDKDSVKIAVRKFKEEWLKRQSEGQYN